MGYKNVITTCTDAKKLASLFGEVFDLVIVDAPCSGEGMFRKDENAQTEWNIENVLRCAERQHEILDEIKSVLKIGGIAAVIVGAYLLWDKIIVNVLSRLLSETGAEILSEVSYRLPQVAVAVLLIVIGVKLITHKKRELDSENNDSEEEDK